MPKYSRNGMRTIRGSITVDNNARPIEQLVFNYESPDRTRGWIVEDAWIWIIDIQPDELITADVNLNVVANLATDSNSVASVVAPGTFNKVTDCDDNRQIGWHQKQWGGKNTNDFYYPQSTGITDCSFLIDIERVVTNELYLNAGVLQSGGGDQLTQKLGFMIVLREVSLTAGQSLIQQLKGIGQNIDN